MDELIKNDLRKIIIKDQGGNAFKYAKQTSNWISLKGPFDVYFTLGCEKLPEQVRVILSLEYPTKRKDIIKNCELTNEIEVENNPKRSKDIFVKAYPWEDRHKLEAAIKTDFMDLVKSVRDELKK